jgi:membrane protein YdbS with pleckstrin-like domain
VTDAGPVRRPEPTRRLPPQARTLWRLHEALGWTALLAGALLLRGAVGDDLPSPLATLLWIVPVAGGVLGVAVVPELRWRRWRYEVREDEIDLRRGAFTVTRTLVPMARVQHVDTSRGLLEQALGVSTVVFHTAAGESSIPALHSEEAAHVRDRIATLARTPDEL